MKIRHGVLYVADLNPRLGTEAGKLRPVAVLQTDLLNEALHPSTWILPCTTRLTGENALRVSLPKGIAGNSENCEIMIDQSRAIDNQRFRALLGEIPKPIWEEIKEKIRALGDL